MSQGRQKTVFWSRLMKGCQRINKIKRNWKNIRKSKSGSWEKLTATLAKQNQSNEAEQL